MQKLPPNDITCTTSVSCTIGSCSESLLCFDTMSMLHVVLCEMGVACVDPSHTHFHSEVHVYKVCPIVMHELLQSTLAVAVLVLCRHYQDFCQCDWTTQCG